MPCDNGNRDYYGYSDIDQRKERDQFVAWLCEACQLLETVYGVLPMSGQVVKWWNKHKEEDEKRRKVKEEQDNLKRIAVAAKAKLTSAEIEALKVTKLL